MGQENQLRHNATRNINQLIQARVCVCVCVCMKKGSRRGEKEEMERQIAGWRGDTKWEGKGGPMGRT